MIFLTVLMLGNSTFSYSDPSEPKEAEVREVKRLAADFAEQLKALARVRENSWNALAPKNIKLISVTPEVFQLPIFWLKALAFLNI